MASFINYNGNALDADLPVLTADNRAFRYGDAMFETIRLMSGDVLYLDKHLRRLTKGMRTLGMKVPANYTMHYFYLLIRHLDQVNNLKGNARVRLEVFRNSGGYYTPVSNEVSFLIEVEPLKEKEYILNEAGLRIDFYYDIKKQVNKLSPFKTSNAILHVLAGIYKTENHLDDCLILNTEERVCESISSSVFLIKGDELLKPSLSQGSVDGVMRDQLIILLKEHGKQVREKEITVDEVLNADEIFLTDVVNGIRWVGACRHKRYFNKFSKWLIHQLADEILIKKV
jgi:branched-subunit amino acid aminotransferase/4-amino-4-deoxychorismate lyase